jgi:two-component system, cell cycle sensor histidine kinase and response regulator CckA
MDDRFALLGRIATGVAHDLNNYLAVVDVSLAILQRQVAAKPGETAELVHARSGVDRAIRLNRTLLEYARGGEPAPADLDLVVIVRGLLELFSQIIPPTVAVTVDVERAPATIRGVASEVEQLLLNLILNACDAMADGGDLRLVLRGEASGAVTLHVIDTGAGMSPAAAREAANGNTHTPSSKEGRHGRGLGVGIVRQVASRHQASFTFATAPTGSVATVTFPPVRGAS